MEPQITPPQTYPQYDRDNGQAGIYAPGNSSWFNGAANLTLVASRAYFCRFVPSRNMTVDRIAFLMNTAAGADDACDVGIYDAAGNKIVSAGATSGKLNGTGVKTVTFAATTLIAKTVYYAALSVGTFGGTAGVIFGAAVANANVTDLFGTGSQREAGILAASHPLPASASPSAGGSVPLLAVRES